ncbi:MAG: ABC transporter substrate-binding protein [Methanomassiliicoccaceae archaeon]|nr:ABC transporter substrate-binding protein [Methanomassiliicoccaceae archaeon]
MSSKIIAAIIIIVLVVAGVGVGLFFLNQDKDKEINILAGVNTDGSGIYIDKSIDVNTMFDTDWNPIKAGWEGKVFGTPGISTIQHVQLLTIVEGMGMSFAAYTIGGNNSAPNTVYFVSSIPNAAAAFGTDFIDGGSLWQPQYEKIVDDATSRFKPLALTNDLFPGHACCVIAGFHGYTSCNENETVRFLAAYVMAVDWVNNALSAGSGEDYNRLVSVAKNVAGVNFTEDEVKEAMETVIYTYGGSGSAPLAYLTDQIPDLAESLVELGATTKTLGDLGFNNGVEFADKFINDSFLVKALELIASGETYSGSKADLRVAVIAGDIHQIAIHMAKELGFFDDFGLNVSFSNATNGPGVATAIQNGDASFGLLGAPPITITVINGELVKA